MRCRELNDVRICPTMTQGASLTLELMISRSPRENQWSFDPHCLHNSKIFSLVKCSDSALLPSAMQALCKLGRSRN